MPVRNVVRTSAPGIGVAAPSRMPSTWPLSQCVGSLMAIVVSASALLRPGFLSSISATTPAVAGDEKLVPLMNRYWNFAEFGFVSPGLLWQDFTFVRWTISPSLYRFTQGYGS